MTNRFVVTTAAAFGTLLLAACGGSLEESRFDTAELANAAAELTAEDAEQIYANFLDTYIAQENGINFVGYSRVSEADHKALKTYITALETQGVEGLSEDEEIAFWINLYNAKTIDLIVENYPLNSIKSLGIAGTGPWNKNVLNVAGKGEMSLNDIEHGTLRAKWDEPRIHYAVNCASYGCPNLMDRPWTAETLEDDFEEAALTYVNHPRGARVEDGKVTVSKIYDWYKVDFGDSNEGVLDHVREYAEGDLADALENATTISKFEYDWSLNGN